MSGLGYIVGETGVYRVSLGFSCIYGSSDEGGEDGDRKKGREWKLPAFCMQMSFFLCGESEEDLGIMVGRFVEVCGRKGLKVNSGNSKLMVLVREEGLECEVYVEGIRLEHVSEFKYLGCVLANQVQMRQSEEGR